MAPRGRRPADTTLRDRIARSLRTFKGKRLYAKRKEIVEPEFGQIKQAREFRRCLRRGLTNVKREGALACAAHNILKLKRAMALA